MELKLKQITFPEAIEFNFQELKQEIAERTASYVNLIYSEDQIKEAKKDIAMLRKFTKALSDERIRVKKEVLKPYEDFESKIKELVGIADKAIMNIDSQLKGYEEQKKTEKLAQIQDYWDRVTSPEHPLTLQRVMNPKWLNATTSMKSIQEEINGILAKYAEDLATLQNLPEFSFEAIEVYKNTLDLGKAIQEGKRLSDIQKRRMAFEAEQARLAAEAKEQEEIAPPDFSKLKPGVIVSFAGATESAADLPTEPLKEWISFKALLSTEDALALKAFFENRNIEFEAI